MIADAVVVDVGRHLRLAVIDEVKANASRMEQELSLPPPRL